MIRGKVPFSSYYMKETGNQHYLFMTVDIDVIHVKVILPPPPLSILYSLEGMSLSMPTLKELNYTSFLWSEEAI